MHQSDWCALESHSQVREAKNLGAQTAKDGRTRKVRIHRGLRAVNTYHSAFDLTSSASRPRVESTVLLRTQDGIGMQLERLVLICLPWLCSGSFPVARNTSAHFLILRAVCRFEI